MPADILLDTNAIVLDGGDVTVSQNTDLQGALDVAGEATLNAKVTVQPGANADAIQVVDNGVARVEIESSGRIYIRYADGGQCVKIDTSGIRVYDSDGYTSFILGANGSTLFYGDIVMGSGADIKIDTEYVAQRLDTIEQRLTNGGL